MGTRYDQLSDAHQRFIEKQPIFFSGSAARDGRVNVSPKGMDELRVLTPNRVLWRNLTGSGNETAAHLADTPRMTLMWCAFTGPPMILRVFGKARAIHRNDTDWAELDGHFTPYMAARQVFDLTIDIVQKSCGYAVPEMEFKNNRDVLVKWAEKKGEDGIHDFWVKENAKTIDGIPTHIVEKNL